jgi:AraC-like DNA-binding protein
MTFNWVDILISFGIFQGLFLIFSLARIKDRNVKLNKILIELLTITSLMLFGRLLYFQFPRGTFDQIALLFDTLLFLFGPVVYAFTYQVLFSDNYSKIRWPLHLIPAGIHFFIAFILLVLGPSFHQMLNELGLMKSYYKINEMSGVVSNLTYMSLSFWLVLKYEKEEKNQLSFRQNPQRFMKVFLLGFLMLIILWSLNVIKIRWGVSFIKFMRYDFIWSFIPFLTYVIGYYMQKQPELFRINRIDSSNQSRSMQRISMDRAETMKITLERLMSKDKIYRQNDLTLLSLSSRMNEKPNDLSWLLNESYTTSFYDFVNQYRVKEFLQKVENNEHKTTTIIGLAMDCGFNSKSTFNKTFKKLMNQTPSEFIKSLN